MVPGAWPQRAGLGRVPKRMEAAPEAELGPARPLLLPGTL